VYEKPVIPSRPILTLAPFSRKRGFAFASRELTLYWNADFDYQNGMNTLPPGPGAARGPHHCSEQCHGEAHWELD